MHKIFKGAVSIALCFVLMAVLPAVNSSADEDVEYVYGEYSDETGYFYFVDDEAGLFDKWQEASLEEELSVIADKYANAGVVTIDSNPFSDAEDYADYYISTMFESQSSVIFLIDMDSRQLVLWANGEARKEITNSVGNIITDNVYRYAHDGEYYEAASKAVKQTYTKLNGGRIASPMKIMSNIAIAIVLSLILTYIIAFCVSSTFKAGAEKLLEGIDSKYSFNDINVVFTHTRREYSPRSSSSGSGGGHSGGGHSGGGGSHGF